MLDTKNIKIIFHDAGGSLVVGSGRGAFGREEASGSLVTGSDMLVT